MPVAAQRAAIKNLPNTPASPKLRYNYAIMIVGITGGVGRGKSTVARAFERRGYRRLDSDRIVREEVLVDGDVVAAIRARFGDSVIDRGAEGMADRQPGPAHSRTR